MDALITFTVYIVVLVGGYWVLWKIIKSCCVSVARAIRKDTPPPTVYAAPPPHHPPSLDDRRFFVAISNQVKGPYSVQQLEAMHDIGAIADDTQCCMVGRQIWVAYSKLV